MIPSVKDRILAALESGNKTSRTIANETGLSLGTVPATLTKLKDEGKVRVAGYEQYGRSAARSNLWEKVR